MESGEAVFIRGTRLPSSGCSAHAARCVTLGVQISNRGSTRLLHNTHTLATKDAIFVKRSRSQNPRNRGRSRNRGLYQQSSPIPPFPTEKKKMWARRGLNVDEKTKKSTVAGNPSCCLDVCPLLCVFLFHILLAVTCFSRSDHQHMPCTVWAWSSSI